MKKELFRLDGGNGIVDLEYTPDQSLPGDVVITRAASNLCRSDADTNNFVSDSRQLVPQVLVASNTARYSPPGLPSQQGEKSCASRTGWGPATRYSSKRSPSGPRSCSSGSSSGPARRKTSQSETSRIDLYVIARVDENFVLRGVLPTHLPPFMLGDESDYVFVKPVFSVVNGPGNLQESTLVIAPPAYDEEKVWLFKAAKFRKLPSSLKGGSPHQKHLWVLQSKWANKNEEVTIRF